MSEDILGVVKINYFWRVVYSKIDVGDSIEQGGVSLSLFHGCYVVVAPFAVVICEAGLAVAARVVEHADGTGKTNYPEVVCSLYYKLVRFVHYCRGEIQVEERHVYYVPHFSCKMNVC